MPYIKQTRRDALFSDSVEDYDSSLQSAGELNYMFTTYIIDYVKKHGLSYQTCNDVVGALENCKDEFQRRIQHQYETQKVKENGDVYEDLLKMLKSTKKRK